MPSFLVPRHWNVLVRACVVASCLVRSDSLANALPHVTQRCGRDVECVTKCESRLDFLLNVLPHNGSGQTKERVLTPLPVLELDGEADADAEADGEAGFTAFAAFVALVAVFFGARFLVDNAAAAAELEAEAGVSDLLVLVRVLVPEFVLVFTVPLAFAFAFAFDFDFVFDRDPLPLVGFSSTFIVASTRCEMLIFLSNDAEEDEDEVEEGAPLDALATSAAAIS